jgi:hypothetical protein
MKAHRLGVPVVLAALLGGRSARATSDFPNAIQSDLNATQAPQCLVCHVGQTGMGTVQTPFGLAMRQRGLEAGDEESLRAALSKMEADKVDSDGDGVLDVDELRVGDNPNVAGGTSGEPPSYGCQIGTAHGGQTSPLDPPWRRTGPLIAGGLAAALMGLRLRRRTGGIQAPGEVR